MKRILTVSCLFIVFNLSSRADQVILDDLVTQGSLGVGTDIVNGENFGFDTIRLKENNLQISFIDTSNSASFPSNDWTLRANESTNGGLNEFGIDDLNTGRTPFSIKAAANEDALVVATAGSVGFGTYNPAKSLHVIGNDSPTLRLDQGVGGGLVAQVWDLVGNETGIAVQDVTNAGTIPFRVRSGTAANSLTVGANGVGIGISSAAYKLHVAQTENVQASLIEVTNAVSAARTVLQLKNNGPAGLQISNNNATATPSDWDITVTDAGELVISRGGGALITIDAAGNLTAAGTLADSSDVNRKESFADVDPALVLEKVAGLPVKTWSYKGEKVTHMGPMAQDFHAAFSVGANDRTISKADADGVALASIQALHMDAKAKTERIEELTRQNQELETRLKRLEALLEVR